MSRGGRAVLLATAALVASTLSACGGPSDDGVLDWYVTQDDLGSQALAETCRADVRVHVLPADPEQRYGELVRRLSADGDSIDLLTLDGATVPELAEAGFLRRLSSADRSTLSESVLPAALEQTVVDDRMYAVPWFFDPQLLWYRGVTAERAGLDVSEPISWDDLIAGAERVGASIAIDDTARTGLATWVTGLVAAAGGDVVDDLGGTPGRSAASVLLRYREAGVGDGPSDDAVETFVGAGGGFLVASGSALGNPALTPLLGEVGATAYPTVGAESVAPATSLVLAVSAKSEHAAEATRLVRCLAAPETVKPVVLATGHAPARATILADPEVVRELPVVEALATALVSARTAPVTPSWSIVRRTLDASWRLDEITSETPSTSRRELRAALRGELP